tara:strand:+ start:3626 stop:4210 length:585 start_codon:yes stop_codon:yes gene_type:complete
MRKEYKFVMNNIQISSFLNFYNKNIEKLHKSNFISSIYYDTNNFEIYRSSLYKDINKYKYRIREYNRSTKFQKELKVSHYNKLKFKSKTFKDIDVQKKIFFKNYTLEPKSLVSYNRNYYKFFNSRLTIDSNIKYKIPQSNLQANESISIVELKILNNSFTDIERYFPSNPVRFSKFQNSITKLYFLQNKFLEEN